MNIVVGRNTIKQLKIIVGKKWDKGAEYIGRGSPLGNPFPMRDKSDKERDRVIKLYKIWLKIQVKKNNYQVMRELLRLQDIAEETTLILGCYCSPKKCHGDYIKVVLKEMIKADSLPF